MRQVTSESPDRKKRIIIDSSSKTVTFINCHTPSARPFFTLRVLRQSEFVCPFADILDVYNLHHMQTDWVKRPPKTFQIATTSGNALFAANWSNSNEVQTALSEISASSSGAPALRNPNIAVVPFVIGCLTVAAIFIILYFWLTGK